MIVHAFFALISGRLWWTPSVPPPREADLETVRDHFGDKIVLKESSFYPGVFLPGLDRKHPERDQIHPSGCVTSHRQKMYKIGFSWLVSCEWNSFKSKTYEVKVYLLLWFHGKLFFVFHLEFLVFIWAKPNKCFQNMFGLVFSLKSSTVLIRQCA